MGIILRYIFIKIDDYINIDFSIYLYKSYFKCLKLENNFYRLDQYDIPEDRRHLTLSKTLFTSRALTKEEKTELKAIEKKERERLKELNEIENREKKIENVQRKKKIRKKEREAKKFFSS